MWSEKPGLDVPAPQLRPGSAPKAEGREIGTFTFILTSSPCNPVSEVGSSGPFYRLGKLRLKGAQWHAGRAGIGQDSCPTLNLSLALLQVASPSTRGWGCLERSQGVVSTFRLGPAHPLSCCCSHEGLSRQETEVEASGGSTGLIDKFMGGWTGCLFEGLGAQPAEGPLL